MSFEFKRKMNYYETDRMGVIHHSNYIRFLEEARCAWLEKHNITFAKIEEEGVTIPVLEVNCKYKNHVTLGDTIIIKPMITEYNGVRVSFSYQVIDEATNKIVIEATTKHCFTDKTLRPVNLKKYNKGLYDIFEKMQLDN